MVLARFPGFLKRSCREHITKLSACFLHFLRLVQTSSKVLFSEHHNLENSREQFNQFLNVFDIIEKSREMYCPPFDTDGKPVVTTG